jgi:hypothetical protein
MPKIFSKEDVMKKWIYWAIAAMLVVGIGGPAYAGSPVISATPMVKMAKDAKVVFYGEGFKPNQEISFLFTDVNGITANLEAYLDPKPVVADSKGQISTAWKAGRYISKKLVKQGVTVVSLADADYNLLAHASVYFYKDAPPASGQAPLVIATPMVKMTKDASVEIYGEGFKPNQEVAFLFTDVNGATADLEAYLDPKPVVANSKGQIATTWKAGRYVSKKLVKPGVVAIRLTDMDYTLLAHDSIEFAK